MADANEVAQLAAAAALPLRDRAKSKLWKARVAAFDDIALRSSAGSADDEAGPFLERDGVLVPSSLSLFSRRAHRDDVRGASARASLSSRALLLPLPFEKKRNRREQRKKTPCESLRLPDYSKTMKNSLLSPTKNRPHPRLGRGRLERRVPGQGP